MRPFLVIVACLIVKKGMLMSIHSHLHGHIEPYNVFELLNESTYDLNFGFLAYTCSWEVD